MKVPVLMATFLATFLCHALALSAPAKPAKNIKVAAPAIVGLPTNIFELEEMPVANRSGLNLKTVLRAFEALDSSGRREFERVDEYNLRMRDALAKSSLPPSMGLVGFVVDARLVGLEFNYDADIQHYKVARKLGQADFCTSPPYLIKKTTDAQFCIVGIVDHKTGTYNGQNAFGVATEVDKERGTYVSVTVPLKHPFINAFRDDFYNFRDSFGYPITQARLRKTVDLRMMLVGEFAGNELLQGKDDITVPRLDHPFDVYIQHKSVPFKLQGIIYFFSSDGHIAAVRDFRNAP